MNETQTALLALATVLALVTGMALSYYLSQRRIAELREENARLKGELEVERRAAIEKARSYEEAQEQLGNSFQALAADALKHNSGEFLKLAKENLAGFQLQAKGELEQREKAVENLVKPIREALSKTEEQIRQMEKERREAYGSLSKHLESMADAQRSLHQETSKLVSALRRPEVRGQWGEMTLKRLAELAGMVEYCDFFEQEQVRADDGSRLRPDMVVRMPGSREIVVDAKTPLDAYLNAVEASDEEGREKALLHHARKVRERVRELAAKSYWQQFEHSPDFVVLFIPGDQFLSAALDRDRSLLEDALSERVILATPTSFVALLRAVGYGWRQERLAENAEQIRSIGEELYGRLATFGDYIGKLGGSLGGAVEHFNRAVGSFDSRILPSARKFRELGISSKKTLSEAAPIEKVPRSIVGREEEVD